MSIRTIEMTDRLHRYLLEVAVDELALLRELREETSELEMARMQISPEQGRLMAFLVELIAARRCLEVGVFTGYSSLCVALALPEGGRLVACDTSEEWTAIARSYWRRAGVEDKIELHLRPARDTLDRLIAQGEGGGFDFAFVDADKENYLGYYEQCLELLRPGGLLLIDNVLWSGRVADPEENDAETEAIREVTRRVFDDDRVTASLVPIGDGLLMARRR